MTQDHPTQDDNLDVEDFTPEGLSPGDEVIDGDVIIDSNGVRRTRTGQLLPGSKLGRTKRLKYRQFKESMLSAFHANGGTAWLAEWGAQHPSQFFRLMARMIPLELQGELKGSGTLRLVLGPSPLDEAPPGVPVREDLPTLIDGATGEVIGGSARYVDTPASTPTDPSLLPVLRKP